jgi:hypothetical protein
VPCCARVTARAWKPGSPSSPGSLRRMAGKSNAIWVAGASSCASSLTGYGSRPYPQERRWQQGGLLQGVEQQGRR